VYRTTSFSRPALAAVAIAALALSLVYLARPAVVQGATILEWGGQGSDNLPCDNGGHWVLAPSEGVTSATLIIDGTEYPMSQSGEGSWSADSEGPVTEDSDVSVSFEGPGDPKNHLQLSHCLEGPPPPPEEQLNPISLTKVDQNGDAIEGVAFTLTGVTDPTVSESGATDASGQLTFADLAAGDYLLTETAPEDCTGIAPVSLSLADDGTITFPGAHVGVSLAADGSLAIENTCTEGGTQPVTKPKPETSVKAVVGGPAASTPNTAFGLDESGNPGMAILFAMILLAGLGGLAYANVKTARQRS
jgi:hypothetical protein